MKKTGNQKRALLMSALALLVCVSMLVGSTFAWFTDSVASGTNIIKAGNLDVEMQWADGKEDPATAQWQDASQSKIFDYDLWEPGYTEVRHVRIANVGTLALQYQLTIAADGEVSKLAEAIDVYYLDPAAQISSRTALMTEDRIGTLAEVMGAFNQTAAGELLADEVHTVTIALKMRESAGNEYKELSIGTGFAVKLFATQVPYEKDSFDETYDDIALVTDFSEFSGLRVEGGEWMLVDDMTTTNILYTGNGVDANLDMNGKTITADKKDQYAFGVQYGGVLRLTGEGTANVGKGFMVNKGGSTIVVENGTYNMTVAGKLNSKLHHMLVQNDSKIVINGGTFTSNVDNAAMIMVSNTGVVEINGGFFENTVDKTPDLLDVATNKYTVNRIIIKGGTFVNYNPLEDQMCFTGQWPDSYDQFSGPWILVWEGYEVVAETQANGDIWYTVVPA